MLFDYLRPKENATDFIKKKLKEIIIFINKLDKNKKIKIIGGVSDGEFFKQKLQSEQF